MGEQTPALNEQGRQCRTCPGEAHNPHISLFESCRSYRRRCTNRVRSTVYRFRICPAAGRARVFRCIELYFYNARSCSRLSVALRSNQLLLHVSAWPIEQVRTDYSCTNNKRRTNG